MPGTGYGMVGLFNPESTHSTRVQVQSVFIEGKPLVSSSSHQILQQSATYHTRAFSKLC
ncbi:uncharacterized protein CLUP02_09646 [Colletotrichum lupini]|uniref:Uncharacterized protein n=1 Tax=Colletotrichum lupini TaxID=145971 RepID=A0A9Q8SVD6_9PEZI|nr:uncharacterized protein CLUP02_09646 [Colletotrichum lupini]UQC84150.1 hypothetical protein CLUP02_09646 [Colletotrichum lupini]